MFSPTAKMLFKDSLATQKTVKIFNRCRHEAHLPSRSALRHRNRIVVHRQSNLRFCQRLACNLVFFLRSRLNKGVIWFLLTTIYTNERAETARNK